MIILPLDDWNTPYKIENNQLISAGPDKQFGTADDFIVYLDRPLIESMLSLPFLTAMQEFWVEKLVIEMALFIYLFWHDFKNNSLTFKNIFMRFPFIAIIYIIISYEFHIVYFIIQTYQL